MGCVYTVNTFETAIPIFFDTRFLSIETLVATSFLVYFSLFLRSSFRLPIYIRRIVTSFNVVPWRFPYPCFVFFFRYIFFSNSLSNSDGKKLPWHSIISQPILGRWILSYTRFFITFFLFFILLLLFLLVSCWHVVKWIGSTPRIDKFMDRRRVGARARMRSRVRANSQHACVHALSLAIAASATTTTCEGGLRQAP